MNLKRKIFFLLYNIIARHLPRSTMPYSLGSKRIREICVRNFVKECGKNLTVETGALISPKVRIGNNCLIGENCILRGPVVLGDDVLMAQNVSLVAFNHNYIRHDLPIKNQGEKFEEICVGNDVWLGINSTVLAGVTIGNHSIVGASALIVKDVPSWAIVGGVPAKVIKKRSSGPENDN